jgi:hypothetical protein
MRVSGLIQSYAVGEASEKMTLHGMITKLPEDV